MRHHDDYSAFELVIKEKLTRQKQDKNKTNKSISYLTDSLTSWETQK